ncbi:MAG: cobalt transporter CbiM [Ancalomicrobiaceae bacterium]|nr:cobalt transporter CbiM [Ancalomicrobiaceae bacterium]
MHIPDGYLSPATCAVAFAAAAPVWYVASRKVKAKLHTKLVPLMAVVSAFSFVVMMFNLPLPGGTTGHAVGMGLAAIVLGPWAAVLSISTALLIQAVFFGDGGITAYGANAFNMAIVGTFVSYWVYVLIAGRSAPTSPVRAVAAGISGYVGINVAAFFAALEFGIQPLLFVDATGAPLYAPYPLAIAVPAMMAGHLTIAGLAEAAIGAGLVRALQRYEPELLGAGTLSPSAPTRVWWQTRALWFGLAVFMILSPIGLIAGGTAWGEWSVEDLADPAARQDIARASGNVVPPATVPSGLKALDGLWNAPFPDYAPTFLDNKSVGYVLSAVMGSGLVLLVFLVVGALPGRRASTRLPD